MGLLDRFRDDVARRHLHKAPVDACKGSLGHAPQRHFEALEPRLALGPRIQAESAELGFGARLARAELDPASETRSSIATRSAVRAGWL